MNSPGPEPDLHIAATHAAALRRGGDVRRRPHEAVLAPATPLRQEWPFRARETWETMRPMGDRADEPFWRRKTLEAMTPAEWESLCDGCGRCCLLKLEDDDTGEVHHTDVGCTLLDSHSCRCRDYRNRQTRVPDCVRLTPDEVRTIPWLPRTCAYRLVRDGHDLNAWHPLVSGRRSSVHEAGISVRGRVSGNEEEFDEDELVDRIVAWPGRE